MKSRTYQQITENALQSWQVTTSCREPACPEAPISDVDLQKMTAVFHKCVLHSFTSAAFLFFLFLDWTWYRLVFCFCWCIIIMIMCYVMWPFSPGGIKSGISVFFICLMKSLRARNVSHTMRKLFWQIFWALLLPTLHLNDVSKQQEMC